MFTILLHFLVLVHWSLPTYGERNGSNCPSQCNCEMAPLRSAPFVMTWITTYGEDDLIPNLHPNDILNADLMVNSRTAKNAGVDVERVGLHVTCSIHPSNNVTVLLDRIPANSMVLSILQSPGCKMTFIDGGQLVGLSSLIGLHLQGYAHKHSEQISGFQPKSDSEMIEHKKLLEKELTIKKMSNLRLALAEDALQPLSQLELLDLQFVRLVSSKDVRRSRRYSTEPVSSTTLLDMPFPEFVKFVDHPNVFDLPSHLRSLLKDVIYEEENSDAHNENKLVSDSYKIKRYYFADEDTLMDSNDGDENVKLGDKINLLNDKHKYNLINALKEDESILVPYEVYKDELENKLAPFRTLKELKYLRVAHARLDRVGAELLDGLQQLHTLTLEYNKIKVLPSGMFSTTPALRHLSMAHNNIFSLESESLAALSQLLTLDMDYNNISILGPSSFPYLPHLSTLRLIGNPITHLLPDSFSPLNCTQNLFIGSPDVSTDVHENTFRFLTSIETLVLKNITKEFSIQKKIFNGMPTLKHLTIHGIIPEIQYDAFASINLLQTLNLSYCSINKLSMDSFYGLEFLQTLDLSNNKIVNLIPGTFDYLASLRELYLNNNLMTTLPLGLFVPIPSVKLIQLNNNPWFCTCDLLQLSPSITNKVKREGIVKCEWNEKLTTVCKKQKDKLIYDARVAPLCFNPVEIRGADVYHAALKHLKCSKHHWDPSLLNRKKNDKFVFSKKFKKKMNKKMEEKQVNDTLSWLPLGEFTPEPIYSKDLLQIAEGEDLEEVPEGSFSVDQPSVDQHNLIDQNGSFDGEESSAPPKALKKNIPQNDQPYPKIKDTKFLAISRYVKKSSNQKPKIQENPKDKIPELDNTIQSALSVADRMAYSKKSLALRRQKEKEKMGNYYGNSRLLKMRKKEEIKAILRQRKQIHQRKKKYWKKMRSTRGDIRNNLKNDITY